MKELLAFAWLDSKRHRQIQTHRNYGAAECACVAIIILRAITDTATAVVPSVSYPIPSARDCWN
jgi:hypothetical protein